jgi:hypothetical protein
VFILRELEIARRRVGLTAPDRAAAVELPEQQPERDHVRAPDRGALEQQRRLGNDRNQPNPPREPDQLPVAREGHQRERDLKHNHKPDSKCRLVPRLELLLRPFHVAHPTSVEQPWLAQFAATLDLQGTPASKGACSAIRRLLLCPARERLLDVLISLPEFSLGFSDCCV